MALHLRTYSLSYSQQQQAVTLAPLRCLTVCQAKKKGSAAANSDTGGPSQHAAHAARGAGTQHRTAHPTHKTRQHEVPVQQRIVDDFAVEQLQQDPLQAADRLHHLLDKRLVAASGQLPAVVDDVLLDVLGFAAEAVHASKLVCQDLSSDTLIQLLRDAQRVCGIQATQHTAQLQLARSRLISALEALLPDAQPVLSKATCSQMIGMRDDIQHMQVNLPEDWCWAELLCDAASRTEDRFLATCNVPQLMVFTQQLTALEPELVQVLASEQLQQRIRAAVDRLVRAQRGIPIHSQQLTINASEPSSSTLPALLTDLPWSHAVVQGSVLSADEMVQLAYMCLIMTMQESPPDQQQWVVQLCYSAIGIKTGHQNAGALVTLCTALLQHNLAPLSQPDVQQHFISSMCDALISCEGTDQEMARGSKPVTSGSRFYPALGDPGFLQLLQLLISKSRLTAGSSLPVSFYGALVSHMRHVDLHDDLHSHIAAQLRQIIMSAVYEASSTEDAASMQPVAAALLTHWQQYAARLLAEAHTDELLQLPQLAEVAGQNMQAAGFQERWEQQVLRRISTEGRPAEQYQQPLLQQVLLPMWRTHQQLPHSVQLMELCLADAAEVAQQLTTDQLTALAMRLVDSPGTHKSGAIFHMMKALIAAAEWCTADDLPEVLQAVGRLATIRPETTATDQQVQGWTALLERAIPEHVSSWSSHQCCVVLHAAVVQLQANLPGPCIQQLVQPLLVARLQDCSPADVLLLLKVAATRTCLAQLDQAVTAKVLQCCTAAIMQPAASFSQQYTALQLMAQLGTTAATLRTANQDDIHHALQASASSLQAGLLATFPAQPDITTSQQLVSVPGILLDMGIPLDTDWCKVFEATSAQAILQAPAEDLAGCFLSVHQAAHTPSWQWLNSWADALATHARQLKPTTATRLLGILHQQLMTSRDQLKFHASWYGSHGVPLRTAGVMRLLHNICLPSIDSGSTVPISELCNALAAAASRQAAGADKLSFVLEGNTSSIHGGEQPSEQYAGGFVDSCCSALQQHLDGVQTTASLPLAAVGASAHGATAADDLARAAAALLVLRPDNCSNDVIDTTVTACLRALLDHQDIGAASNSSTNSGGSSSSSGAVGDVPISTLEVLLQACVQRKVDVPAQVWEVYQSRSRQQGALAWGRSLLLLQQAGRSQTAEDLQQVAHAMANDEQHDVELAEKLLVLAQMQRLVWSDVCTMGMTLWHAMTCHTNKEAPESPLDCYGLVHHPDVTPHYLSWLNACRVATTAAAAVDEYLTSCVTALASFEGCVAAAPAYVSAQVANIQLQHACEPVMVATAIRAELSKQKLTDLLEEQDGRAKQLHLAVSMTFKSLEQGLVSMASGADDPQAAAMWCDVLWVAAAINIHVAAGDSNAARLIWPQQQPLDPDVVHPRLLQAASCGQPLIAGDLLTQVYTVGIYFMAKWPSNASLASPTADVRGETGIMLVGSSWVQHHIKLAVMAATACTLVPLQVLCRVKAVVARQLVQAAAEAAGASLVLDLQQQLVIDVATITCGQPLRDEDYAKLKGCLNEGHVVQLFSSLSSYLHGAVKSAHKLSQPAMQRLLDVVDATCALVVRNYAQPPGKCSLLGMTTATAHLISRALQQLQFLDPEQALHCTCNPYLRRCTMHLIYAYSTSTPRAHDSLAAGWRASIAKELHNRPWCTPIRHAFMHVTNIAAARRGDMTLELQDDQVSRVARTQYTRCMDPLLMAEDEDNWLVIQLLYSQYVRLALDRPLGVALQANLHLLAPLAGDVLGRNASFAFCRKWICLNISAVNRSKQDFIWLVSAPAVEQFVRYSLAGAHSWEFSDRENNSEARPVSTAASVSVAYQHGGGFIGSKYGRVWRLSLLYGMTLHTPGVDKDLVQDCKQRFLEAANAACKDHTPTVEAVLTWTAPWLVPGLNDKPVTLPQDMPIESWLQAADWSSLTGPQPRLPQLLQLQTLCFTCPEFYRLMKSVQHRKGVVPVPGTHRYEWVYSQSMQALGVLIDCITHMMPSAAGDLNSLTVAEQLAVALRLQLEVLLQKKTILEFDAEELYQLCLKVRSATRHEASTLSAQEQAAAYAMRSAVEAGMTVLLE